MNTIASMFSNIEIGKELPNAKRNTLGNSDHSFHDWYRFVLSYPPQIVRKYLYEYKIDSTKKVLDPFCGTGTTNVECKLLHIPSVGIEINPFPFFASKVKTEWNINADLLIQNSKYIARNAYNEILHTGIDDNQYTDNFSGQLHTFEKEKEKLLIKNSISPIPKHKLIILFECIQKFGDKSVISHQELAFANALVFFDSNLSFGPEVGVGKIKNDIPVIKNWLNEINKIAHDISKAGENNTSTDIYQLDSRELSQFLEERSINCVITSPPYPNEKDYTRTTRLESVFLNFICNSEDLRNVKNGLVRSNTRGIYKADEDYKEIEDIEEIMELAERIENRRVELNKTSGFEKMYHKVTKNYFGGMARHLKDLRTVLKPGAQLAYVVGDQASYFRILIKTSYLLGVVAKKYGYEIEGVDLFRTRLATTTRAQLNEEVLLLKWPG